MAGESARTSTRAGTTPQPDDERTRVLSPPAHVNSFLTEWPRHDSLDTVGSPAEGGTGDTAVRLASALACIGTTGPLEALLAARELASAASDALQEAVDRARGAGHSWREIGDVLGTTRQAAFQRFGHPIDPRTGVPMSKEVPAGTADRAVAIVASIADGQWQQARRDFSDRMSEALDAARLGEAWARVASLLGSYEGMGEPFAHRVAEQVVVEIPLRFEAGEATARIVFDTSDKVAGLWFRPAEA
jgi:hypothetical protein